MITLQTNLTTSNTSQQITGTSTLFNEIIFCSVSGFISNAPVFNPNPIYIGVKSGEVPIVLFNSGTYTIDLTKDRKNDLSNFWFAGTAPQGVYVIAQ